MKSFFAVMALVFSYVAYGNNVSPKNGNFHVTYSDIRVSGGGRDLEIVRTHNSRAPGKGIFGQGWGSFSETKVRPSADGSIIIYENGSGAKTRFLPKGRIDPGLGADKIIKAMKNQRGDHLSDSFLKQLKEKLKNNQELRASYAKRFNVRSTVAAGTVFHSNQRGLQKVYKLQDGYKRTYNDGKEEHFNEKGDFVKLVDKHGYTISLEYSKAGHLKAIKDSQAKQLLVETYPNGLVKAISSTSGGKAEYKYDKDDALVYSKDAGGNVYKYKYDKNMNMTQILYSDGTTMDIKYTPRTWFVKEVKDREGRVTKYSYGSNPENPDRHYWTEITKTSVTGRPITNRYEYEMKARPDGSVYTYRTLTIIGGVKRETIYSECCSLPLKIAQGKDVTTFEYNDRGLLVKKSSTRGEYIEIEYHDKINKITKVTNKDGWTNFAYDQKGNLQKAVNDKGQSVLIFYNRHGRITKMVDSRFDPKSKAKKTRALTFVYNTLGKPTEIAMSGVGKINVAYKNNGDIQKVDSKAGQEMALQVTRAFQSLVSIVKPAGVNLSL